MITKLAAHSVVNLMSCDEIYENTKYHLNSGNDYHKEDSYSSSD